MFIYLLIALVIAILFGINTFFLVPNEIKKFSHFIQEGKFEEAMKIYQQSLKNKQHHPAVTYGLAQIYEFRKEWYLAVYSYGRLLKRGKYPPGVNEIDIRLKRINANKMVQQYEDIADDCYSILKIDPSHESANYEIGKRLFTLKNYRAARPYLERINKNDSKEILGLLLDIEINEKNFNKAFEYISQIKKIYLGQPAPEVLFKEIFIHFNLNAYAKIVEINEQIDANVRKPTPVGVIIGLSLLYAQQPDQAFEYFNLYLKNYLDDQSDFILEGRYQYTDLLIKRGLFSEAYTQNRFIEQVDPDYRDVTQRGLVIYGISGSKQVKALLGKSDIREIADEVVQFNFPDFFFIENRIVFNGDNSSNQKWVILNINTSADKVFHLFVCFNLNPFKEADVNRLLFKVREEINSDFQSLNFIFLSLYGMGVEAEKTLLQTFKNCFFYDQEDFINYFESRKLPMLPD